jgi:hypothetical protein
MLIPAADEAKENAKAPEKSPVIGDNWDLERVDFIHYAKPDNTGKPEKPPKPSNDVCYKLLGVKWKALPVDYVINPGNPDGLTEEFVLSAIAGGAEAWDAVTSVELLNDGVDYTAEYGVQNYVNAVVFGAYPEANAIAVTSIWYTRRGKQIVEFDMIFNTGFAWGDGESNPAVMDLLNIATHEFGHSVGMGDIYTDACSAVTMYGYSNYGDIAKRSLEQPDITGLLSMYGP